MERKPLIALTPSYYKDSQAQAVYMRYVKAIERAGGVPIVIPMTSDEGIQKQMAELCDGALFTGGDDIHPSYYGCCLHEHCGELTPQRDEYEFVFGKLFLATGKPFLGICRGIQFINVAYGGTLYQDLPAEYKRESVHRQPRPYNVPYHSVSLVKGGKIAGICGMDTVEVNSMHHQAVKKIGAGLVTEGVSPDGVIEAVVATDRDYGVAVQWHPEHLAEVGDKASLALFSSFVNAAKKPN
ncbi:MAG: gamma-glutamyl-gamma-aminobutyrate hydrolase family protein [Clostridia bacterium]|nr:gamma-glutamyl-gamma-aminobutyrate hydrolase family protein [Clostridia bacterium]